MVKKLKIAQITLWDGSKFFMKDPTADKIREFFKKSRRYFEENPNLDQSVLQEIKEVEMTEQEYKEIPATNISNLLL